MVERPSMNLQWKERDMKDSCHVEEVEGPGGTRVWGPKLCLYNHTRHYTKAQFECIADMPPSVNHSTI